MNRKQAGVTADASWGHLRAPSSPVTDAMQAVALGLAYYFILIFVALLAE